MSDGLRRQNPDQADSQIAVLELWGNGNEIATDLPEELYFSFGIPKPQLPGRQSPPAPTPVPSPEEPPSPEPGQLETD